MQLLSTNSGSDQARQERKTSNNAENKDLSGSNSNLPRSSRTRGRNNALLNSSYKRMSSKRLAMMRMNASISSITEDEPIVCFDGSGLTDMSSLSFLTCSSGSLQQLPNLGLFTQGPSLFDEGRGSTAAPKMPKRANDSRQNLALSGTDLDLGDSQNEDENAIDCYYDNHQRDDDSAGSLSLEDILEESNHSSSTANTRQWNESSPKEGAATGAVKMPTRGESLYHISGLSFALDSSTSIAFEGDDDDDDDLEEEEEEDTSYASSATIGSFAGGDSFSRIKISSRCAV